MKKSLGRGLKRLVPIAFVLLLVFQAAACVSSKAKDLVFSGELKPTQSAVTKVEKFELDRGEIFGFSQSFEDDAVVSITDKTKYGLYDLINKEGGNLDYDSCVAVRHGVGIMGKTDSAKATTKYGAVNCKGEIIVPFEYTIDEIYFADSTWYNCIVVKDRYYDLSSGQPILFDNIKNIMNIGSVHKSDNYIYGSGSSGVYVFDLQANFIKFFEAGDNISISRQVFVMGGDNILIQSSTALPLSSDEKYDYSSLFYKFKLKTEVYNLKTGKTKTVKFDYLIDGTESNNTLEDNWQIYNKSMKDLTVLNVNRITDKTITGLGQDELCVVVDSNLKIQYEIPKNAKSVKKIADDRFFIWGGDEGGFITNGKGETLAALGPEISFCSVSDGLIVVKNESKYGVIDMDGRIVVPFEYIYISDFYGNTFASKGSNFYDDDFYTIDRQGNAEQIDEEMVTYMNNGVYITSAFQTSTGRYYCVYNYNREKLLTFYGNTTLRKTDGLTIVFGKDYRGDISYYTLSQEQAA